MSAQPTRGHLHRDDQPLALAVLATVLAHRLDRSELGYEPTGHGAWVDWLALIHSKLSDTEIAAVHFAWGCAVAERHGGLPPHAQPAIRNAIAAITDGGASPALTSTVTTSRRSRPMS